MSSSRNAESESHESSIAWYSKPFLRGFLSKNSLRKHQGTDAPSASPRRGRKLDPGTFMNVPETTAEQRSALGSEATEDRTAFRQHRKNSHVDQERPASIRKPMLDIDLSPDNSPLVQFQELQDERLQDEAYEPGRREGTALNVIELVATTSEEQGIADGPYEQSASIDSLRMELDKCQTELEGAERLLAGERGEHQRAVEQLNETIKELREQAIGQASKSAEMPTQSPLLRPESEILERWLNLTYDVRNLVDNHFSGIKGKKMVTWAQGKESCLQEVTPNCLIVAADTRCSTALIEAAIWNILMRLVLGNFSVGGPMCWAGSRLCTDVVRMDSEKDTFVLHQWKALTTSLVSNIQPSKERDREIENVVDELEDLLGEFRYRLSFKTFRPGLKTIVSKAIELDKFFYGQQAWYCPEWPSQKRHDFEIDQRTMKKEAGSPNGRLVKFAIRPCLYRAGGRRESYGEFVPLDLCRVWMND
ncbi:hypothetical protein ACJZ2D_009378 [Fusarium nematophilum]